MDTEDSFYSYTVTSLEYSEEGLTCGRNGLVVRNYNDTSDKQLVIVDNNHIDGRIKSDSYDDKHKQEEDINTISEDRSNQRNAVHIDIIKHMKS